MKRKIKVFLADQTQALGQIMYDAQGNRESAAFEYSAEWLANKDLFAIDPNLPLKAGPHFHRKEQGESVFHGIFSDTEPDGWARRVILRDHAKQRKKAGHVVKQSDSTKLNTLDYLLAVDDFSRVGALRFQDEQGIFQRDNVGKRGIPPLIELSRLVVSSRAVETNSETAADLEYLRGKATSLGGLRPKCSVLDNNGELSIGKFPSVADERSVTKGEILAMNLALKAGVNAAHAQLVDCEGTAVALIKRFDRGKNGKRILYASAATMLGVSADSTDIHTYTEIVDAIRRHGATVQKDIEELWRRIAFSILISNVDDHLLNHGFLHVVNGQWQLAPAFDLNPFPERVRELKTWISLETGPEASIEALMSVVPYFKISTKRAKVIILEVRKAVSNWQKVGKGLGMSSRELAEFADAF